MHPHTPEGLVGLSQSDPYAPGPGLLLPSCLLAPAPVGLCRMENAGPPGLYKEQGKHKKHKPCCSSILQLPSLHDIWPCPATASGWASCMAKVGSGSARVLHTERTCTLRKVHGACQHGMKLHSPCSHELQLLVLPRPWCCCFLTSIPPAASNGEGRP